MKISNQKIRRRELVPLFILGVVSAVSSASLADSGGGPHSHGPEGPLAMKIVGGIIIVAIAVGVYFGFLKKK